MKQRVKKKGGGGGMGSSIESYPFRPLFSLRPEQGRQATADQFCLGREEAEVLPSGSLDAMMALLNARRRGVTTLPVTVPVTVHAPERVVALADGPVEMRSGSATLMGSNDTLDTLESSVEMLSLEQAANLSPTNAPVLKPGPKRPTSVKSV